MKAPETSRTAELLALIKARPGITTLQICSVMGIAPSTVRNMMMRIRPSITSVRTGVQVHYFLAGCYQPADEDDEPEAPRPSAESVIYAAMQSRTPLELAWSAA